MGRQRTEWAGIWVAGHQRKERFMKRFGFVCALLVLPIAAALAEGEGDSKTGKVVIMGGFGGDGAAPVVGVVMGPGMMRGGNPAEWDHASDSSSYIKEIDPVASLTDDQKKTIADLYAERSKELKDFSAANSEK